MAASWFGVRASPPVLSEREVLRRLLHILPAFTSLAKWDMDDLGRADAVENKDFRTRHDFYNILYPKLSSIQAALTILDPDLTEITPNTLLAVLDEFEKSFLSWKKETDSIYKHLEFQRHRDDRHPKLKAMQAILPENKFEIDSQVLGSLRGIIRLYHKKAEDRDSVISALDQAFNYLMSMQPRGQSETNCPLRFSDYPVKHMRKFSRGLIVVLQERWKCTCGSPCHRRRVLKLDLTQYQRFETGPCRELTVMQDKARFRVMFPTGTGALHWKGADISVRDNQ